MPNNLYAHYIIDPIALTEQTWEEDVIPLVSISCVTYNHAPYICEAIDSFLAQKTTFPVEVLIHDDASNDGTTSIIKKYEKKYPGLIFPIYQTINQYSKGKKGLFTYLLPRACGKYIALCDGDDFWTDPLKLQRQVDFLETNPEYSGTYHDTVVLHENQSMPSHLFRENLRETMSAEDTISKNAPFHTSSFVFRRNAVFIPPWIPKVKSGDMALFSIVAASGPLRKVGGVCSVYRKHDSGITNSMFHQKTFHQDRIELIKLLNQFHQNKYYLKALSVIEQHKKQIMSTRKTNYFSQTEISIDSLDTFFACKSQKDAIDWALPVLRGRLLDAASSKMPYKDYILSHSSVSEYIGLDLKANIEQDEKLKFYSVWDGNTIPFENDSFDCCIISEVLEHCPDPEILLFEINRVLKPGSIVLFIVPFLWYLHGVTNGEYRYTPFSLERHLKNVGFTEIEIKATGGWHASLAQMLGLWVRRAPMSARKRKYLSMLLKPLIKVLIDKDNNTIYSFSDSPMITGLYGLAKKEL